MPLDPFIHHNFAQLAEGAAPEDKEVARHYQAMFNDPIVLEDLKKKFCFYETTAHERFTELREGSRMVILYILMMLSMDTSIKREEENEPVD